MQVLGSLARAYDFKLDTPWNELSDEQRDIVLHGTKASPSP
jgi:excinuclease ABC subunit A